MIFRINFSSDFLHYLFTWSYDSPGQKMVYVTCACLEFLLKVCSNMRSHIYGGPIATRLCINVFDVSPNACVKWKLEFKMYSNDK